MIALNPARIARGWHALINPPFNNMKYDLDQLVADQTLKLQWHGAPTLVLVAGDSAKTEVETGGVLEVTLDQAKQLLHYSHLWTLEGDEPTKHGHELAMQAAFKAQNARATKPSKKAPASDAKAEAVTLENVAKLTKPKLQEELKKRGKTFNDKATKDELQGLLVEALEAEAGEDEAGDEESAQ